MSKIILAFLAAFVFSLSFNAYADNEVPAVPFTGEINENNINVRCDATVSSDIICTVNKHVIAEVTAEAFGWYKIRLPRHATCYINARYVDIVSRSAGEKGLSDFGMANADSVNIRLQPDERSCILGRVDKNKALNIISKEGDWFKIYAPDTTHGWINKKFVSPLKTPAQVEAVPAVPPAQAPAAIESEAEKTKDGKITVMGIIEPYGKFFGRKGTHKIITHEKRTYILKGDKKLLNSCSYREVAVKGKLQETPGQEYPLILVDNIEVLN
jgi:uncharacterized protein YgiM (DUF1202 family)